MNIHVALKPRLPRNGEIRRSEPADRAMLVDFQRKHFGEHARQLDPAYFSWLYECNPCRGDGGAHLWVFQHGGEIAGQQGGIPFRLKAGDRSVDASWAVDLMVAPEWRLRGIGPALSEMHNQSAGIALSLGMSEAAYRAYRTAGWIDLGNVPTYLRILDPARCARVSGRTNSLVTMAARVAGPLCALYDALHSGLAHLGRVRLVSIPAFDARADALWRSACSSYPVLSFRDWRSLSWRFDAGPAASRYMRFYLTWNGAVTGYIVLRIDEWKEERIAILIDYFASPRWLPVLFAHAIAAARKEGAIALACRTLNHRARTGLKALGFLMLENGYRNPTRMLLRFGEAAAELSPLVAAPQNWLVTAADSDTGLRDLTP